MSTPDSPGPAEFDRHAESYDEVQQKNLGFLGRDLGALARYKVDLTAALLPSEPRRILEFGCGTGRNLPFLRLAFPDACLEACDVSSESLKVAATTAGDTRLFLADVPENWSSTSEPYDLIFIANVLHHIPTDERLPWLRRLATTLAPGGHLVVFEHNPWNPITRYLVSTCPFDEGVELVWPRRLRLMLAESGLHLSPTRYTLLTPWRMAPLVALERLVESLPLGGQYCLVATLPATSELPRCR